MIARRPRFPRGPAAVGITKGNDNAHYNTHYICHDVGDHSHSDPPRARAADELEAAAVPGDHAAMVRAVLERVGLPADAADRTPDAFSGGLRQRIAVARAIVHGPELLVGDEPVSALDVLVRARVLELLGELRREFGLTLVTITHDLGIVPQLAERTIVMQGGKIVEDGPTATLLSAPSHPYTEQLVASRLTLPATTWRG